METEFTLVIDLMPAAVIEARAKSDEVRGRYADALNKVAAEFNPQLSAAFSAQLIAEKDIRVTLLQRDTLSTPSPVPSTDPAVPAPVPTTPAPHADSAATMVTY